MAPPKLIGIILDPAAYSIKLITTYLGCLSQLRPTFRGRTGQKVGLRAKRRNPGANAFFPLQFLREDPIFSPISQQPTVETFSTHANRLIKC